MKIDTETNNIIGLHIINNNPKDDYSVMKNSLSCLAEEFDKTHIFFKGQFVKFKSEGLKDIGNWKYGEPAIVRKILDSPVTYSKKDASMQFFNEVLNIIIGFYDDDGDYLEYYVNSKRFEPFD